MTFDEMLRELRHSKLIIFVSACLGIGCAIAYWSWAPQEFESFARVLVLPKDPTMASATRENESHEQEDVSDDLLATHIELIRSDAIVEAALKSKELEGLTSIEPHLDEGQSTTDYISSRLWAFQGGEENGKDARLINVGFRHFDAEDSRRIVEAVVKAYQSFLTEQFEDVSTEATGLISQAQGQLERELESLEAEHLDLRRQGPIQVTRGDRVSNIHEDNFAELEKKIADLRVSLSDAKGRLNAIRQANEARGGAPAAGLAALSFISEDDASRLSVFTDIVRSSASQPAFLIQQPLRAEIAKAEYQQLVTLHAEEQTLLDDYGSKHPDVTKVRNEIVALEGAIKKRQDQLNAYDSTKDIGPADLLAAYTTTLESDVTVMTDRLEELQTMASQEEAKAKELINFQLHDKVMSSRIDRKQQLYDAVVSRVNDVGLRRNYGSFVNKVLVPPKYGKRVWPKLSICGLVGMAAGLLLGCLVTFATFVLNKRYRSIGELSRGLRIPVIATLPKLDGSKWRWSMPAVFKSNDAKAKWSRLLDLQFANRSAAAIAVRSMRNWLFLDGKRGGSQVLLITSPLERDGKSTVAANLALSIAHAGRSVVLVDANIANPQLHVIFNCTLQPGLGDVLGEVTDLADSLRTLDTHLELLPAGALKGSTADAFQSARFAQLFELIRERFEYVVIDSPSILNSSETQVLASLADHVLLVTRVSHDTRAEIMSACKEIERHGGHLVGAVANTWDASKNFNRDADELALQETWQAPRHSNGHADDEEKQLTKFHRLPVE